jgi:hypothetical protein
VVAVEQITPAPVAQRDGPLRSADDVGEHDRGQDPIGLLAAARAREEFLDLVEDGIGVADPRERSGPGSSTYFAPWMRSAMYRAFSTRMIWSPARCMMSVGTRITDSACRASVSWVIRSKALIPAGLTARRSKRAHDRRNASSRAMPGAK